VAGSTPRILDLAGMKVVFFSDTHLRDKNQATVRYVERFIEEVCVSADMVFVVGDLFEFYHGYEGYIYPWFRSVIEALKSIADQGKPVWFIEGNHEFGMGGYFESYTGIHCSKSVEIELDGRKVFVAHGDDFSGYSFARLFRSRIVYGLMDLLGPGLSWKAAMVVRFLLSNKKKRPNEKVMKRFRNYAKEKLDMGYEAVILAHSHMPDRCEFEYSGQKRVYLNTGDLVRQSSYVEYTSESGFNVRKYVTP
jgi:UDP-2,3-diacylglucosamine hydrolase